MRIKFLGTHNTESRTSKLVSYLIDEILAIDAGSLTSELSFSKQQNIKAILLTHGHYDHIRGVPAFAFANSNRVTPVFGTAEALDILRSHLLDGIIYPKLADKDSFLNKPAVKLITVKPLKPLQFEGYQITAVPVNHSRGAVGYEIKSSDGHRLFCTGDTGPGLKDAWQAIHPDTLIVDVTFPNESASVAEESGHLCPDMLAGELVEFKRIHKYIPRIIVIHLSPRHQKTIEHELQAVSQTIKAGIEIAPKGKEITL